LLSLWPQLLQDEMIFGWGKWENETRGRRRGLLRMSLATSCVLVQWLILQDSGESCHEPISNFKVSLKCKLSSEIFKMAGKGWNAAAHSQAAPRIRSQLKSWQQSIRSQQKIHSQKKREGTKKIYKVPTDCSWNTAPRSNSQLNVLLTGSWHCSTCSLAVFSKCLPIS